MDFRSKLVYAFNTFFGDFLNHAKTVDETIKKRLRKRYRVIDRSANAILLEFCREAKKAGAYEAVADTSSPDKMLETRAVLDMHVAQAMPLGDVLAKADEPAKAAVLGDVAMMCGVSRLYDELCDEVEGESAVLEALFERLMEAIAMSNDGRAYEQAFKGIVDDEISGLFRGILHRVAGASPCEGDGGSASASASTSDLGGGANMEEIMAQMKNSKLGEIAEEISRTIDKEKLAEAFSGGDGMESVIQGLMTGQNVGMIGELVQKVGDKINAKLQNGDMKEEDLLKDAFSLMGKMKDFSK